MAEVKPDPFHGVAAVASPIDHAVYAAGWAPVLNIVRPWEGDTGGRAGSVLEGSQITALAAAPDGRFIVAASRRLISEIYRFTARGESGFPFETNAPVLDLDVGADSCTVFYSTTRRTIRRVNICSNQAQTDVPVDMLAGGLRLLPDGTLLLAPSNSGAVVRVSAGGAVLERYDVLGPDGGWVALDLAPDGRSFYAARGSGLVEQIDLASGQRVGPPLNLGRLGDLTVIDSPYGSAQPAGPADPFADLLVVDGVPTLTGEALVGLDLPQPLPDDVCAPKGESRFHFVARGPAVGPYVGSYEADATATIGPPTAGLPLGFLGLDPSPIVKLEGQFTITGVQTNARISGTFHATKPGANIAACTSFSSAFFPRGYIYPPNYPVTGYYWGAGGDAVAYETSIAKGAATYFDSGQTEFFTDEYQVYAPDGSNAGGGRRYAQSFLSSGVKFAVTFGKKGQTSGHTARLPRRTNHVVIVVRWKRPSDAFLLSAIKLQKGKLYAYGGKLKPGKLKITTRRTKTSLTIGVANVSQGTLSFAVKARKLTGPTSVETQVTATGPSS